jgi:hypothetical protein
MRRRRERILLLAADSLTAFLILRLGQIAHRLIGEDVVQPVVRHVISYGGVAVLEPLPRPRQHVRGP